MKGTFGTKARLFVALLALGLLAGGVGLAAHQGQPGDGGAPAAAPGKVGGGAKATRLLVLADVRDSAPGRGAVFTIDPETGAAKKLVDAGVGGHASVSPDGKAVLFVRDGKSVYRCDTDGGAGAKKLCEAALTIVSRPIWSRDARHFYLSTGRMRSAWLGLVPVWSHETWRYDADGRNPVKLNLSSDLFVSDLSPDGKSFLAISRARVRQETAELGVVRTDGMGYRRLSEAGGGNVGGRFSPDGRRVAYCRFVKDGASLVVVGADGEGRKTVFVNARGLGGCCWSPDGKRLAVLAYGEPDGKGRFDERIEVMGADGKGRRVVPVKAKVGVIMGLDWYAVP